MLEMNIKYNSHNSVTVLGYFFKMPLISGGGRYFRGDSYFRDLIGGQKINVTFGRAVTFGILRYFWSYKMSPAY